MFPNQPDYRDSNAGLDPEDIVPSALGDGPMRADAQPVQKKQHQFIDDMVNHNRRDLVAENDYAEAMRDMQRDSVSTPIRTSESTRRATPPG
jgi:hypothetical protein